MPIENQVLEQVTAIAKEHGPVAAAEVLVEHFRSQQRYNELFEARKMLHRLELGLPAVAVDGLVPDESSSDPLSNEVQEELDRRLLDACREVGSGLMKSGRIQEGWLFLRAVGDHSFAADAMAVIEPTQENLDLLLTIYVHEGVDCGRGTRLSLEMRGTCNTITMLDSVVAMRGRKEQQAAVAALVEHVHSELLANLVADLRRRNPELASPFEETSETGKITDWLGRYPGLLRDGTYHLDTTHLASTVRFARVLDDHRCIRLAADLAEYGRQLHAQYQYQSEEPFADLYPMSLAWFRALLGEQVDGALRLFRQKAETLDAQELGTIAIETYADLLARVGRPGDAAAFLMRWMPQGMRPFGIAPSLLELAQAAGDFQPMMDHARNRGDLIGYTAALLQAESTANRRL
jgi:hypothetical protein